MAEPFDVMAAHYAMLPLGRPVTRPSELSGQARLGAVLLLLYCHQDKPHLVLTKRRADLKAHGGQISFPGGRHEEGETLPETAVRETCEEIGVSPSEITILGTLKEVYIPPSDFQVHPFVGWIKSGKRPNFAPSEDEVSEIIEVSLETFFDDACRKSERRKFRGDFYDIPYFDIQGHKVWGATAVMLNEFIERLRSFLS